MISRTKRNVYIAIITLSVIGILGIILFLKPQAPALPVDVVSQPPANTGVPAGKKEPLGLPKVFPQETDFDLSVFNLSKFTDLKELSQLSVEVGELGKEDPFKP